MRNRIETASHKKKEGGEVSMNDEFVFSILILGSTILAFLASLSEQRRNHQPVLFTRILRWERLEEHFSRLFLMGVGAIIGGYVAGVLNSLLGIENTNRALLISVCGILIGVIIAREVIFEKMVAPQFRAMHDQKIISSLQPPEQP